MHPDLRQPSLWLVLLSHHRLTTAHLAPAHLQTTTDRLGESRAALEKKAALYDRLARGEVDDEGEGSVRAAWAGALALDPSQCTA